uniref:Probable basic-leucine zipper transcription factor Q n=1 Tax=Nicotiana tabacum TaxID=4097 RepID=A0A1S3XTQ6_TOBAC|nr:PREDICTED: probable basic-leucine zipper transcription factor Q [Nicotiana tabacum]
MASVDATIAPLVATAPNAYVAWTKLTQQYANKSQTRVYGLQGSLNRLVKGTKPVAQYLNEIRALADEISIAGSPIDSAALVIKVLSGLGPEYNEMSAAIRARDIPITLEEFFDKLSSHEVFLHHRQESAAITSQYTQRSNQQNRHPQQQNNYNSSNNYNGNNNRRNYQQYPNENNNWRPNQSTNNSNR